METWFYILTFFVMVIAFKLLFCSNKLPPSPLKFPIIGNILCLTVSFDEIEDVVRSLHAKLGSIITLYVGYQPVICIADRHLAYDALIRQGAVFSNRLSSSGINKILNSNHHNISSGFYGPTWRLFRRNLVSGILHLSQVKMYSTTRKWVLQILINRLQPPCTNEHHVSILEHFQYAMFCLLAVMCFGDNLDEKQIQGIMRLERAMFLNNASFSVLNFWPRLSTILFPKRWSLILELRKNQEDYLIPLIRERSKMANELGVEYVSTYVDTILNLQLPDDGRKLSEEEMVTLCNEFLNAGTDTTSTALEWIMVNLVKYPKMQETLFEDIKGIIGENAEEVKEEDLEKMPYLKAVVLEALRRHPPAHFVVPHAVTEDVTLGKYSIPKNATINFMVAEIGLNPKVWEDPMAFKPERFMSNNEVVFDITGSREIKMMPFGAGRRICPAYSLAMLHLEYFVANLVWKFEWNALDRSEVDLSEKAQVTVVLKNPLKPKLSPRF